MSVIKQLTKKTSSGTETHDIGAEASNVTMSDGTTVEAAINSHIGSKSNPHGVTKSQIGLGNVPNVATNDQTPTFSQASSRANIVSGEKLSTIFGKIMKFFADLKAVAFSGSYTDLVNKPTNMTPTSHASLSTTYGAGNGSSYGHLKLSAETNSTSGVSNGTAATPSAVKAAYDLAASKAASSHTHTATDVGALPIEGGTITDGLTIIGVDGVGGYLTVGERKGYKGDFSICTGGYLGYDDYMPNEASDVNAAAIGGYNNVVNASNSSILGGLDNVVSGDSSAVIAGAGNTVTGGGAVALGGHKNNVLDYQVKMGNYSSGGTAGTYSGTTGDAFIIGNGTSNATSNCFRVTYAGGVYGKAAYNSTGADYAECFEWADGNPENEDRTGYMTALEGNKIRLANENDPIEIQGVVSALPAVVGDNYADDWHGKYLKDKYGRLLAEHKVYEAEYDSNGTLICEAYETDEYVLNPAYNADEEYIPRLNRKEYSAVGTHGKLAVRDDGTCVVGGFCKSGSGGIATSSESGFYVMERIDDETVKIYIK